jgi:hypothetical protein
VGRLRFLTIDDIEIVPSPKISVNMKFVYLQ